MIDPQTIILSYISDRLTKAFCQSFGKPDNSLLIDWNLYLSKGNLITTSCPYKLAQLCGTTPNTISDKIVEYITDPKCYFLEYYALKGYVNIFIKPKVYYDLLPALKKWLDNTGGFTKTVTIGISSIEKYSEPLIIRARFFLKAKQNLLKTLGYQVQEKKYHTTSNIPTIIMTLAKKQYQFNVAPISFARHSWEQILELFSISAIKYIMLNSAIYQPVLFNNNYLKLHTSNPLYLLDYYFHTKIPDPTLLTCKTANYDKIIFEIIKYPYILEKSLPSGKFSLLFIYLICLTRLTFEYSLWQNCNEKISIKELTRSIVNHALNIIEYNF